MNNNGSSGECGEINTSIDGFTFATTSHGEVSESAFTRGIPGAVPISLCPMILSEPG